MSEFPTMVEVEKVVQENRRVKTIYLDYKSDFKPGQFYMLWIPGVDEKPYVFSSRGKRAGVSVHLKGRFSKMMFGLKPGDKIGVRGPYGNGFDLEKVKKACIVAGGIGAAPTITLAEELKKRKVKMDIVLGARNSEELFFENRFKKCGNLYITTDDGSKGEKGFATDTLHRLLKKKRFDAVYGCGPELMLSKAFEICRKKKQRCQFCLERYMKCAIGICGECVIDNMMVCRDGPVFNEKHLARLSEFGKSARLKSGRKIGIKEYYAWRE